MLLWHDLLPPRKSCLLFNSLCTGNIKYGNQKVLCRHFGACLNWNLGAVSGSLPGSQLGPIYFLSKLQHFVSPHAVWKNQNHLHNFTKNMGHQLFHMYHKFCQQQVFLFSRSDDYNLSSSILCWLFVVLLVVGYQTHTTSIVYLILLLTTSSIVTCQLERCTHLLRRILLVLVPATRRREILSFFWLSPWSWYQHPTPRRVITTLQHSLLEQDTVMLEKR